jgi:hypothetical protein
LAMELWQFED